MSLMDNNNGMVMPVSPMYGGGNGFGGYGGYGDGLFWNIILFLFAAMNGNGFGGWGGNAGGVLPFMMNQSGQSEVQRVVDQQSVMTGISALSAAQTAALEQYLAPTPKPCYTVQNPNCCPSQTFGCGCGAVA